MRALPGPLAFVARRLVKRTRTAAWALVFLANVLALGLLTLALGLF